jgi:predicted nucleotidyltransferase
MIAAIVHTDKVLENIVSQIVRIAHPDKIILFGSRAIGKAKKDSDYDVLILKKYVKNNRKSAYKIRSHIDVFAPMDIIVTTLKQYEKLKDKWFYIYSDIHKFGKVVYEKN